MADSKKCYWCGKNEITELNTDKYCSITCIKCMEEHVLGLIVSFPGPGILFTIDDLYF